MSTRRTALAVIAALTLAGAVACSGGGSSPAPPKKSSPAAEPKRCPLTGVPPTDGQDPDRVALAVKIDNVDVGRPQAGIDRADLVVEETVEGGLTRLFVVFQCNTAKDIGPIRSARTSDAALLRLLGGAVFGYSGANPRAIKPVEQTSNAVLLSYDANPTLYHRVGDRPAPHNVFTKTQTLLDAGQDKDDSLEAPPPLFTYTDSVPSASPSTTASTAATASTAVTASTAATAPTAASTAKTATKVDLRWSPDASASWSWAHGRWVRTQNGTADVLTNHKRVAATNVVVMKIKTKDTGIRDVVGNPSPDDVITGSGKVWVFRDGKVFTGRWKRHGIGGAMTLQDANGAPLALDPGVTWIELLPPPQGTIKIS